MTDKPKVPYFHAYISTMFGVLHGWNLDGQPVMLMCWKGIAQSIIIDHSTSLRGFSC